MALPLGELARERLRGRTPESGAGAPERVGVPLRADFPRSGEDVAQRQKGESGCERSEQTEGVKPEKAAAPYGVQRLSLEENEELVGMRIT